MRLRRRKNITSIDMLYASIYILIMISCLPITMCLPSIIRQGIQVLAAMMFLVGLLLHTDKRRLMQYIVIVVFVTIFAYGVWQNKKTISSCAVSVITGWAFACFGLILRADSDNNRKKKLLYFFFAITVLTAVTTIIGIQRYPLVVRELGRGARSYTGLSGDEFALVKWEYRISNIAGWNQLYGIAFFTACLAYLYKLTRRKIWLVGLLICEICVIRSQLTFAMLLSILLVVFSFITPSLKKKSMILLTVFLFFGLIIAFNIDMITLQLASLMKSLEYNMLGSKLYDLHLLTQGVSSGDALGRMQLYSQSIDIFKENVLFGSFSFGNLAMRSFSQHSDFFDMLGFYGLSGIILVVFALIRYLGYIVSKIKGDKWQSFILFVAFIALFVFNPIWYSPQVFISVFMLPGIISASFQDVETIAV